MSHLSMVLPAALAFSHTRPVFSPFCKKAGPIPDLPYLLKLLTLSCLCHVAFFLTLQNYKLTQGWKWGLSSQYH